MKLALKTAAILLVLLLATQIFASCAKPDQNAQDSTDATNTAGPSEVTEPVQTEDINYILELPGDLNYAGRTIRFLVQGQAFAADEFYTKGTNGEIVNDAVYERNMAVEDLLGVTLEFTLASASDVYAVGNTVRNQVNSGTNEYNISTMPGYTHTTYVLEGSFYNLLDVENLDLDKFYWTQGFNQVMSNGTKQYVASGAYSLSMFRNMYITLYNKDIFVNNELEDLYDIVMDGRWTLEKEAEMAKNLYSDKNGNSQKDLLDMYGYVSGASTSVDPFWVSLGMRFLTPVDGEYVFNPNTEKLTDCVDKLQDLLYKNEGAFCVSSDSMNSIEIITIFSDNRAAMCTTMIFQLENFLTPRGFESDYGIAPMPKYNEDQENYYTHIQDQLSVMSIIATAQADDLAMLGAVMEAISAFSYKHVYNAYYKTALSYKYLQNEESVAMLDLIYRSIRVEGAFIYSAKYAMLGRMRSIVQAGTNTVASVFKAQTKIWDVATQSLNESIDKLNH